MKATRIARYAMCLTAGFVTTSAFAGGTGGEWADDFDTYAVGDDVVGLGDWEHWDDLGESIGARITDGVVQSAPNAVMITGDPSGDGANDSPLRQFAVTEGIWDLSISQYIPPEGTFGRNGIILLNQYVHGCAAGECNWSAQIVVDAAAGTIESQFQGETFEYPFGQWNVIRVRINLDADQVDIFLNEELIDSRLWTDASFAGGPGIEELACMILFGWDADFVGYYDDISFTEVPPLGGCCLPADGSCLADLGDVECNDSGGIFQGFGSSCAASTCYVETADGWVLDFTDDDSIEQAGGFTWGASTGQTDTCEQTDDCDLSESNDVRWVITVPRDGRYSFSVCDADYDTQLFLGSSACTDDVADNDDGCGLASEIVADLAAGTYYLTLEGFSSDVCGTYSLNIQLFCEATEASKSAVAESEACGDDTNGGCNLPVPAFEPIELDVPVFGTYWAEAAAGSRDTDWYEVLVGDAGIPAGNYTFSGRGDRVGAVIGFLNAEGTGNCADVTGITPFAAVAECGETVSVTRELFDGTWWMFAAPQFGGPVDIVCGELSNYEVVLTEAASTCTPSADIDGNGFVEFSDLLAVLANWSPEGCDDGVCEPGTGDTDCDGDIDFTDLLNVLANWDPQP